MRSVNSLVMTLFSTAIAIVGLTIGVSAQEAKPASSNVPLVTDWSHHHLIFSAPDVSSLPLELRQEPRYWQQRWRRDAVRSHDHDPDRDRDDHEGGRPHRQQKPFKRDWAMSLGPGGTVGAGQYPAKFSFSITTAHCGTDTNPDYVAFNTSLTGSATQASVIAFDNLYLGCTGGTVPSTYWAYNTGGKVVTSSALSIDGTQLVFVQSVSNQAQLVLLKWAASTTATVTSPDAITSVSASQYAACTAPCMTAIPFSGGANDTNSSPYPDYSGDAVYVGDDAGVLHKFTPIFRGGTPAEVTSGWPVTVAAGLKLNSPVFDGASGRVFVGSGFNGTTGAQLFAVTVSGLVTGISSSLGKGSGIATGSLVDSSAGKVFVFVGNDGSASCAGPCDAVYQFPTNFTTGSGVKATVGIGGVAPLYPGAFDNDYFKSGNGTGNLFVCGGGLGSAEPTVSRVPMNAGVMSNSSISGPAVSTSNVACSPVTDVFNPQGNVDRVFAGVTTGSDAKLCSSGGCITNLLTNTWQASKTYTMGQVVLDPSNFMQVVAIGGTSGTNPPSWIDTCGNETADGGITWVNAGFLSPVTFTGWQAGAFWSIGSRILDSNQNIECSLNNGPTIHSGATPPTWNTSIGGITNDFTQQWRNGGPMTSHSLPASGGTSGIIIDNVVAPGALGTSEVYFSTLGTAGTCGAGNGCAVQASQSGLN